MTNCGTIRAGGSRRHALGEAALRAAGGNKSPLNRLELSRPTATRYP